MHNRPHRPSTPVPETTDNGQPTTLARRSAAETADKLGIQVNPGKSRQIQVNPGKSRYFYRGGRGGCRFSILYALFSILLGFASPAIAQSVYENYTFLTLAGPGEDGPGWFDGSGTAAHFFAPAGIARDSNGNFYLADSANNTIRKITLDGSVTTLAGLAGSSGTNDGIGAAAQFNTPYGIAVGADGTVYVADSNNHTIRKITPDGMVTTLAGRPGTPGTANGTGSAARFNFPRGVVVDSSNNVYVADTSNDAIRKITPAGVVSTIAGSPGKAGTNDDTGTAARFNLPVGMTMDSAGNLYVADFSNSAIRKITTNAVVSTLAGSVTNASEADGTNTTAGFDGPFGITLNGTNELYVTDSPADTIRKVTLDGVVTTIAGIANQSGSMNAVGTNALFSSPAGIVADGQTNLFVCDFNNDSIREIAPDRTVTLFVGGSGGSGTNDGSGNAARFNFPAAVAVDSSTSIYVADHGNHSIRKITPDGVVTTVAGLSGVSGTNDGTGTDARFEGPAGITVGSSGNVFVADNGNDTVREVTPLGVVTTLAGSGTSGTNNGVGTNAMFSDPIGIAVDSNGNLFVSDSGNQVIREIAPDTTVTTFAGTMGVSGTNDAIGTNATFDFPEGVAFDNADNLYVADEANSAIRRITPDGTVTTYAGVPETTGSADGSASTATFNRPFGVAVDANSNVYVADSDNGIIRKITPGGTVTTIAGSPGATGNFDGTGSDAQFNFLEGMAVDAQGNVYVADANNHSIRKGYPAPPDVPVVDFTNADIGVMLHFSISNETTTNWSWTFIRQPSASTNQIIGANTDTPTFTPDVEDIYIIQFQGWDNSGRTVIRRLTLHAHNGRRLTVQTKGGGNVKPDLNGSLLQIGTNYTMTAIAVPGSTFSNWMAMIGKNAPFVFTNSPTISFAMQNDLTLIANFHDHQNPTLLITSPKSRQFASNAVFTVTGTAKDNDQVTNVWYQLNGGGFTNATGTSNWQARVALNPGENTVLAYSQDASGNVSATNRAMLNYVPSARLRITGTGAGTLSPNYVNALLAIDTNYTMTAKAAKGYSFSNWVDNAGNVVTTNPVLKFMMQSNSAFVVNFTRNGQFFAQGQYAGLFYDTNNLTATNAGFFSAAVTLSSAFTAKLLLGGSSISTSGQFSTNGVFSNSVPTPNFGPVILQLQLDLTGQGTITGTIAGNGWSDTLLANQLVYSIANPPSQQFQRFTLVIPGGDDSTNQPGGNSYGNITVDNLGTVTFTGVLADGSKAAQKTFFSRAGQWPFYISSANGQGVTLGWLTFSPGQGGTLGGHVYWDRLPGGGLYPNGFNFTNGIDASGSFYSFFIGRRSLNLTNGMIVLQQAEILPAITNYFTLIPKSGKNILTSTNGMNGSINVITGVFKGTVMNPADNVSIPVNGVLLQNQTSAFGFFTNSNQSGSVFLGAPPQ